MVVVVVVVVAAVVADADARRTHAWARAKHAAGTTLSKRYINLPQPREHSCDVALATAAAPPPPPPLPPEAGVLDFGGVAGEAAVTLLALRLRLASTAGVAGGCDALVAARGCNVREQVGQFCLSLHLWKWRSTPWCGSSAWFGSCCRRGSSACVR